MLSYRVFYFERGHEGRFNAAQHYPAEAMACIATHDLPPLRGWWEGRDIEARVACGMYENSDAVQGAYNERAHARWMMLQALREAGAFDGGPVPESSEGALHEDLFVAAHRYMARTPCRLFALQLEDIAGAVDMVNLPGTDRQHANWRRKLPTLIEELPALETLRRTLEAVARERPRQAMTRCRRQARPTGDAGAARDLPPAAARRHDIRARCRAGAVSGAPRHLASLSFADLQGGPGLDARLRRHRLQCHRAGAGRL